MLMSSLTSYESTIEKNKAIDNGTKQFLNQWPFIVLIALNLVGLFFSNSNLHTKKWAQSPLNQCLQPFPDASSCTRFFLCAQLCA